MSDTRDMPSVETPSLRPSVNAEEVRRFTTIAREWWEPHGKFRPLHRINPVRLAYIRDQTARHFGRDPLSGTPLYGLRALDIGCGGGLVSEPLARMGARVTGIDAGEEMVRVARLHAAESNLDIDYRTATVEELAAADERFDLVLCLEVVEHVGDVDVFLDAVAALVAQGGVLVLSTLNRTLKSFLLAIIGAEYVLGWLPRGTHDWHRFLTPDEVTERLKRCGLVVKDRTGLVYDPLRDRWSTSRDLGVNYFVSAVKP